MPESDAGTETNAMNAICAMGPLLRPHCNQLQFQDANGHFLQMNTIVNPIAVANKADVASKNHPAHLGLLLKVE